MVKNSLASAGDVGSILVREDSTHLGAMKPVHHSYRACALGPGATTTEARVLRAHAPQQEMPLQ